MKYEMQSKSPLGDLGAKKFKNQFTPLITPSCHLMKYNFLFSKYSIVIVCLFSTGWISKSVKTLLLLLLRLEERSVLYSASNFEYFHITSYPRYTISLGRAYIFV